MEYYEIETDANGKNFRKIIKINSKLAKLYREDPSAAENLIDKELENVKN